MNRFNFKTTIFCLAISLFTLAGCSKDDPNPTTEEINKSFIKKSYEEQVKDVEEELAKWEDKSYVLTSLKEFHDDGTYTETLGVNDCANFRIYC